VPTSGPELDALVARAQAGEVAAFESLVAVHFAQVRRYARAFEPQEADADDLAQEALLKVHRCLRQFRYQSSFSTWLFAVVRTTFLDTLKSRARRDRGQERPIGPDEVEVAGDGLPADEGMARDQEKARLWQALRQVSPEFRSAVVLFDLEGHAYDEVAAIEGVPVGTVRSRLSRGREQLRRALTQLEAAAAEAPGTSRGDGSSHLRRSGS
jgi:RNA polymerase sigma-70 factor (ECF subfamily)